MIGTAVVAFRSGLLGSIIVAFLSQWLGSEVLVGGGYFAFLPVHIVGAIGWTVLIRSQKSWLGSGLFDPNHSANYRNLFLKTLWVGLIVGSLCAVVAVVIQNSLFPTVMNYRGQFLYPIQASNSGIANIVTAQGLLQLVKGVPDGARYVLAFSALSSSVIDKMATTAIAVALVYTFLGIPNIKGQQQIISAKAEEFAKAHFFARGSVMLPIMSVLGFAFYMLAQREITLVPSAVFVYMAIFAVMLTLSITNKIYICSVDRELNGVRLQEIYHEPDNIKDLKFVRDAFEDILKCLAWILLVYQLYVAIHAVSTFKPIFVFADLGVIQADWDWLSKSAASTLAMVTFLRYGCVICMRFTGRF